MEDEDDLRRDPPSHPYVLGNAVLGLPHAGLAGTLSLLQKAGNRESGAIWYGPRAANGSGEVRLIIAPKQTMSRGNYHISSDNLTMVVRRLPDDWKPLAQVHSHPGYSVEHSRYDDRMALSHRALSVVFPLYGHLQATKFPAGLGIHEFQDNYWHLLPPIVAARRVVLIDRELEVVDLR